MTPDQFTHKIRCPETKQDVVISFWPLDGVRNQKHAGTSRKRMNEIDQKDRDSKIALAYMCGNRMQQIMDEFHVSTRTIMKVADRFNIKRRGKGGVLGMKKTR